MISRFYASLRKFRQNEEGASLVEYGLLVSLIALAVIATLRILGTQLNELFLQISNNLVS